VLSSAKESVVSSTGIGDKKDASRKMEIEVETGVAQGGAANNSSREVQTITSPNKFQVEDDCSIAHDRPRKEIRRPAHYADSEGLVVYAFAVVEEIPEITELSTYTEAISCPSSPNWILAIREQIESLHKNRTEDLCELPKCRRALTAKRIYKRKEGIPRVKDAR